MQIRRQYVFRGPSLLAEERAIRLTLDPREEDLVAPSELSRQTAARLEAVLPDDQSLWDADEAAGAALSLADCIARLALLLQREFGYRLQYREVLAAGPDGLVDLAYAYADPGLGVPAGRLAVDLTMRAMTLVRAEGRDATESRLPKAFQQALSQLRQVATFPPTRRTLWEADRRGIPWSRVPYSDHVMQLGQGHKRRRFRNSYWHETPYLSVRLAIAKAASADILRRGGLPVPRHHLVNSAEAAVSAAENLGYPVVVKPNGRDMGTAVSINLQDAAAVRAAFATAQPYGQTLVEEQIPGLAYRVTVLNGRMIAAGINVSAHVIGDGQATIEALIDRLNSDPRRGRRDYDSLKKVVVDAQVIETLADQGYALDSVPAVAERIDLRPWWKDSPDYEGEDVTGKVHPLNQAMMERAARLVGLDLAGVDFITPDISRPWQEVGGAINEINPTPGLTTHVRAGAPDVHRIIVEENFPPGDDGRIPLGVVAAAPEAAPVVRLVAGMLDALGHRTGTATSEGFEIAGLRLSTANTAGAAGAEMAFSDPLTTAAVLEVCDRTAVDEGLGFDRTAATAIMQAPRSEAAARLLLRCASDFAILNADLPDVAGLADSSGAQRILWVSRELQSAGVAHHIAAGGAAVIPSDSSADADILLWDEGQSHAVCRLEDLRTEAGLSNAETLLFAVALTYGLTHSVPRVGATGPTSSRARRPRMETS